MVLSKSDELANIIELCLTRSEEAHPDLPRSHRPPVVLAIDGPAGAGKTTLSHHLAPRLVWEDDSGYRREAAIVHLDDLYNGWADGPAGGARRVAEQVLKPLAKRKPGRYHRYDWTRGEFAEPHDVEPVPFLVVEGSGAGAGVAQVPQLAAVLVWLDADDDERIARVLARDGEDLREDLEQWIDAEHRHFAADGTRDRADVTLRRDTQRGQWVRSENSGH